MPEPAGERLPPDRARAARRAAALLTHWRGDKASTDGEMAVIRELETEDDWFNLVCALLSITDGIIRAGQDGRAEDYVAHVLREAMLDEVAGG